MATTIIEKESKKIKFIDLFAGVGGIRQGFEDENTKCVFSSEWDRFSSKTYEENYGEKPFGDITKIKEEDIPKHDVLLAGFPCQPFQILEKEKVFLMKHKGHYFLMYLEF